ncbi:MAG: hypothetical protein A2144_12155 [Chloroflexi bacterium RBG_16_50_9]|nr:MAG: hypothetical protein A2144_12155 [Chloroflexi bacterium RBG_16_50_9]
MRQKVKVEEKAQDLAPANQCHHYWVIEVANGPESKGVCKYCGEVKHFLNTMPVWSPTKRDSRPLDLPKMPEVELDGESNS